MKGHNHKHHCYPCIPWLSGLQVASLLLLLLSFCQPSCLRKEMICVDVFDGSNSAPQQAPQTMSLRVYDQVQLHRYHETSKAGFVCCHADRFGATWFARGLLRDGNCYTVTCYLFLQLSLLVFGQMKIHSSTPTLFAHHTQHNIAYTRHQIPPIDHVAMANSDTMIMIHKK